MTPKRQPESRPVRTRRDPSPNRGPAFRSARFILQFLAAVTALVLLASTPAGREFIREPLASFFVRSCSVVLSLLGDVVVRDSTLWFKGFGGEIVEACDGFIPAAIFVGAVLAYPSGWRAKVLGIPLGLLILGCVNVLRLSSLMLIGAWRTELFAPVHLYFWQTAIILLALALWLCWVERWAKERVEPA